MAICLLLTVGAFVPLAIEGPLIRTLVMTVPFGVVLLVAVVIRRQQVSKIRELELWRSELESERRSPRAL
jgi:hypothetical protein